MTGKTVKMENTGMKVIASMFYMVAAAAFNMCMADVSLDVLFTKDSSLRYKGPDCSLQESGWVSGEKLPVIDEGKFEGTCPGLVGEKGFSVALFFRPFDKGIVYANPDITEGMLVSAGSGWFDGWRLVLANWARKTPSIVIGRPGAGGWGLSSPLPIIPSRWNVVCVTYDRASGKISIYVNGALAAEGVYKGVITPYRGDVLTVGNAGHGVGSLRMQVRRLVADNVPWDAQKVRDVSFGGAVGIADFEAYLKIPREKPDRLVRSLADILRKRSLNQIVRSEATDCLLRQFDRQPPLPASTLERISDEMKEMFGLDRLRLETALAKAYAREGGRGRSHRLFGRLVSTCTNDAWQAEIRWNFADTLLSSGNLSAAREQFDAIRSLPGVAFYCRGMAALSAARVHEFAGEYGKAIAEFKNAAALCAKAPHLKWLAETGSARCLRLADGKPEFDPSGTHHPPAPLPKPGAEFYVSPNGSDDADGSSTRPFATLERARRAVNAFRDGKGAIPLGGVTVHLRGGLYAMTESFKLTAADSGSPDAPVVYRAWGDERPILSGGAVLTDAAAVSDPEVLKRLPEGSRGNVLVFDLKRQGVTNLVPPVALGFTMRGKTIVDFYENGAQMTCARWPNDGFAYTGLVPKGSKTMFHFDRERLSKWAGSPDVCMSGYWSISWADNSIPVAEINPRDGTVRLSEPPFWGVKPAMPFYVFNALAELDRPGEWVLDRPNLKLYFWPREKSGSKVYALSLLRTPLVSAKGIKHIVLDGLTLEYGQGDGISVESGRNIVISRCRLHNLGGKGIVATGCSDVQIYGNKISDVGATALHVSGGDRRTLRPSGINIENNEVFRFGRNTDTYNLGVNIGGCGVRVAHNHFHHGPTSAIRPEGNDHVIEYNLVERMVLRSDDQGGIDVFGDPSYRGVVMRHNIWQDFGSGDPAHWQGGIRLDDAISGAVIYGNRFYRCSSGIFGGVQIHGGQFNTVDNNIFVGCRYGVSFAPWLKGRWEKWLDGRYRREITKDVNVAAEPYTSRYPELARLRTAPNANTVSRNLVVGAERVLFGAPDEGLYFDNRQASGERNSVMLWDPLPPVEAIGRYPNPRSLP